MEEGVGLTQNHDRSGPYFVWVSYFKNVIDSHSSSFERIIFYKNNIIKIINSFLEPISGKNLM